MSRIPPDDDWRDHAEPCPNCDKPVLKRMEHFVPASMEDDGWWDCDAAEDDDE